jgi:hypothetical protein
MPASQNFQASGFTAKLYHLHPQILWVKQHPIIIKTRSKLCLVFFVNVDK